MRFWMVAGGWWASLSLVAGAVHAEGHIAAVDMQAAVLQTEEGAKAQATLKKLFDRKQQELDQRQADLGRMREDIEKQSNFVSRETLARRMDDWQKRRRHLGRVPDEVHGEQQGAAKEAERIDCTHSQAGGRAVCSTRQEERLRSDHRSSGSALHPARFGPDRTGGPRVQRRRQG